jgi:glycosyltransferase involved in cell wall biosynthesis
MLKPYKSRGGRIFYYTDQAVQEQWRKQGRNSFVLITDVEVQEQVKISHLDGLHVYYPGWSGFLMHDGYGYIDYQYRTYGKFAGLFLDTTPHEDHKFALVHHNPMKVTEVKQHWKKPIVAYTMWESDVFPERFFDAIKDTHAVIVPSNFVKNVLTKQGYTNNIYVCNQGVDTNHYQYFDRPSPEVFRFLHNATGNPRKGWEYVIKAFEEEFKNDKNVRLTMKGIIKQKNNPQFVPYMNIPNVDWIDTKYTREETIEMYHNHHCMVFPTKGEGWGLVPHEAILTGLPTITTMGHSIDDYWTSGMVAVKAKKAPAKYVAVAPLTELQDPNSDTWKNVGEWFESDVKDLRKKMRLVYTNWEQYKKEARVGSNFLAVDFNHTAMVNRLKDILQEIHDSLI